MFSLKIEKIIDGMKDIERKNMKELYILAILSKIFIQNANSVLILCSIIIEPNTEFWRMTERF